MAMAVHASMMGLMSGARAWCTVPTRHYRLRVGHAVLAVGYDHARRVIIFRNSWGRTWGDRGYGYLPYAFFASSDLTWDFWTMRRVS